MSRLAVYRLAAPDRDRRPAGRVDALIAEVAAQDRLGPPHEVDVASHHPTDGSDPARVAFRAGRSDAQDPDHPVHLHRHRRAPPSSTPTTGRPTCATPVRFSQAVAAAGQNHGTFVEISPTRCWHTPSPTPSATSTTTASEPCSATPTTRITSTPTSTPLTYPAATTPHPPEPHPVLPATPWHHTSHWIKPDPAMESAQSQAEGDWDCEFAWPVKPMSSTDRHCGVLAGVRRVLVGRRCRSGARRRVSVTIVSAVVLADDSAGPTLLDSLGGAANVLYAPDILRPNPSTPRLASGCSVRRGG